MLKSTEWLNSRRDLVHNNRAIISINESKSCLHQWQANRQASPKRLEQHRETTEEPTGLNKIKKFDI